MANISSSFRNKFWMWMLLPWRWIPSWQTGGVILNVGKPVAQTFSPSTTLGSPQGGRSARRAHPDESQQA
jgi:hypothetical protein